MPVRSVCYSLCIHDLCLLNFSGLVNDDGGLRGNRFTCLHGGLLQKQCVSLGGGGGCLRLFGLSVGIGCRLG